MRKEDGCHEFELPREIFENRIKNHANGIAVKAEVTERGTGEQQSDLKTSDIHRESCKIDFLGSPSHYYPYLPYTGKVKTLNGAKLFYYLREMLFSF